MKSARRISITIIAAIAAIFLLLYFLRYSGLEHQQVFIPTFAKADSLKIPPRPGTDGIVISGPVIEDLVFDIDLAAIGVEALDWNKLENIDPMASVKIRGQINGSGELTFARPKHDIIDSGHPSAGKYIERILLSWNFFPYKEGTIRFYFNVASKGRKLIIDASSLKKSSKVPDNVKVVNGLLYYIPQLKSTQIGYYTVAFNNK